MAGNETKRNETASRTLGRGRENFAAKIFKFSEK